MQYGLELTVYSRWQEPKVFARPRRRRQPAEAEAGEEDCGREEEAKEDKGEKEYHGGQIGYLAGEGTPAVLCWVADIIDRPLRCIEAPSWARRDVDEGGNRYPQGTSCHTEAEWKLFDQLVDAKHKAAAWLSKIRMSEHHMRTGAFRSFDINEAIKTSDRRIAEKALKNTVPVGEEPGDSEPA